MGTSEIYRAVLREPEVRDALVLDLPTPDRQGSIALFLVLDAGATLDEGLQDRIKARLREDCSPRHVPNTIEVVPRGPSQPTSSRSRQSILDPSSANITGMSRTRACRTWPRRCSTAWRRRIFIS